MELIIWQKQRLQMVIAYYQEVLSSKFDGTSKDNEATIIKNEPFKPGIPKLEIFYFY